MTYDNGVPDNTRMRDKIPKGGESRAIDLRGAGKQSVRRVELLVRHDGLFQGKADVTVFGQKSGPRTRREAQGKEAYESHTVYSRRLSSSRTSACRRLRAERDDNEATTSGAPTADGSVLPFRPCPRPV